MNLELLERLKAFVSEVSDVSRDHESGYGGTYNRRYAEEREEMAWARLRELADEGYSILNEIEMSLKASKPRGRR